MRFKQLKKLTATHRTELFILALGGIFNISFGVEKLFAWANHTIDPLWAGTYYLSLGLLVAIVGVINLIQDVKSDCTEDCEDECCNEPHPIWSPKTMKLLAEMDELTKKMREKYGWRK